MNDKVDLSWRGHLATLLLCGALTAAVTYPLPVRMDAVLAGDSIDSYINPWADWWTYHVLTTPGESLYHTDYLFYPDGASLVFHSFSHTNTALSLALQTWLGQPSAYNVTILLAYLLSAYGMCLLVRALTGSIGAGLVAGVVFAFNPYHIYESAHPVLVSTQWMPLTVLFVIRWLRERRTWLLAAAALFFVVNALTSWHLMVFLSILLAAYAAYYLAAAREPTLRTRVRGLVAFVASSALLVAPFLLPLVRELLTAREPYLSAQVNRELGMDLMGLIVPSWVSRASDVPILAATRSGYLGIITVGLASIGVVKNRKHAGLWLLAAVVWLAFAIGPELSLDGQPVGAVSLPWSRALVPLIRHPFRLHVLVHFCLAVAAGYGWAFVRARFPPVTSRFAVLLATGAVLTGLTLDYGRWPFPTTSPVVSPFYKQLGSQKDQFAIAPFPSNRQSSKYHLYYQTIHGKPIVGGHISRTPAASKQFLQRNEVARIFSRVAPEVSDFTHVSREFAHFADLGIRYVVFHKDQMSQSSLDEVRDYLALRPAYEDRQLVAYRTDLLLARDYALDEQLTRAVGFLRADVVSGDRVPQGALLDVEVYWGATRAPEHDLALVVKLTGAAGVAQTTTMPVQLGESTTRWVPGTLIVRSYAVRVNARVPPGSYQVRVGVADQRTRELQGRLTAIGTVKVQPVGRSYTVPALDATDGGCFGGHLCLLGYSLREENDKLDISTHWRAEQLMQQEYVLSTRLVDPDSGAFVCQSDAVPRDWTYPTTWWDEGEVVSNTTTCRLEGYDRPCDLEIVVYQRVSGDVLGISRVFGGARAEGQVLSLGPVAAP